LEEDQTVKRKRQCGRANHCDPDEEREVGMKTADLCRERSVLLQLEGQVRRLAVKAPEAVRE
jgi:hypothetical protein